jgi:hypothetical protein
MQTNRVSVSGNMISDRNSATDQIVRHVRLQFQRQIYGSDSVNKKLAWVRPAVETDRSGSFFRKH